MGGGAGNPAVNPMLNPAVTPRTPGVTAPYPAAPIGGGGAAPNISQRGRAGSTAKFAMRLAGVEEEQIDEWENMSVADIDAEIFRLGQALSDCKFRKRMRKTAREHREERKFEVEDGRKLKLSHTEKIVIDRVPPALRRTIMNRD
jgi:hypothetical protein